MKLCKSSFRMCPDRGMAEVPMEASLDIISVHVLSILVAVVGHCQR